MKADFFSVKKLPALFFLAYLITGILFFRDAGLSWDEGMNRIGTALPEYNFVFHGDHEGLLQSSEKYHGPAFELLLLSAERITGVTDSRAIYSLRHFLTFFFFWISSIFFFLLSGRLFKENLFAMICVLMYVLSPRIFGETFYNSKDAGFLAFFTISLYTMHRFLERKNFLNAFLHALAAGFMVDIRITGILIPFVTIVCWFADAAILREKKKHFAVLTAYLFLQFGFIVLWWPVLWLNPLHHLREAFVQMSDYPWHGIMLFMGHQVTGADIPWYYIPVWILISVPFLYTLFFLAGASVLFFRLKKITRQSYEENKFFFVALVLAIVPVLMVIFLKSVVYDGWRHLYFVYAPFVLVAGCGVHFIYRQLENKIVLRKILQGILLLEFLFVTHIIFHDHPFEHVYFNQPAKLVFSPLTMKFDADYWGLSYRQAFEELLARDTSEKIHVRVESDPGIFNLQMLPREQRARIILHDDIHAADYWVAEFRGRALAPEQVNATIVSKIRNSSGPLITIYKGLRAETVRREIFFRSYDFEDIAVHSNLSSQTAAGGKHSNELNAYTEASEKITCIAEPLAGNEIEEIQLEAMINAADFNPQTMFVIHVMRDDSVVFWRSESLQDRLNAAGEWEPVKWNMTFPSNSFQAGDKITAYVWNTDQSQLFVDDFKMSVVRYDAGEPKKYFPDDPTQDGK